MSCPRNTRYFAGGIEDAEKLDAAAGKQGFFSKLFTPGVEMGDRDTDYLKQYRGALLNGRTVIGVVAKDDEARNKVRKIQKNTEAARCPVHHIFRAVCDRGPGSVAG